MAKKEEREIAREMYVRIGKTQKEIADQLKVSTKTINGWAQADEWENLRAAHLTQPAEIVRNMRKQLLIVAEANAKAAEAGELTPAMVDSQSKIAKSIGDISQELPLDVQLAVLESFMNSIPVAEKVVRERIAHYQILYLTNLAK